MKGSAAGATVVALDWMANNAAATAAGRISIPTNLSAAMELCRITVLRPWLA
ncbi:hypothetical protein QH494_23875 [Sphingomonas sp. AR_OL41]|uniref:hypothetical protein n=1 Tax=Sphingomonas sp. AR_OL41 TaxID=3042729 RepID=UPI002480ED14|nr:hypothetical protein [Sphingomonas sp. AR_OL41]MDH7975235.1 hypothetical protein [Sphingomonas sp. AR_OL41]